MQPPADAL